jgi:hypothetical protein
MARRLASALACAVALASPAAALFSTTLHGAPTEQIEPGTPGAATLELQPWLTTVDPDVRAQRRCRRRHTLTRSGGGTGGCSTRAPRRGGAAWAARAACCVMRAF